MMQLVDIVSSRVKAEVLRLLFGIEPREFHLRDLARQSQLALGTVQQELKKLVRAGLVVTRKDGNRVYYQANKNNPVFADLRKIVLKTTGLVNILEGALDDPDIQVAFVFGSVASQTARPESDVDLMVIGDVGLRRLAKLLAGATEKIGREINPHVLTKAEFCHRRASREHFISSVLASPRLFIKGTEHELAKLGQ